MKFILVKLVRYDVETFVCPRKLQYALCTVPPNHAQILPQEFAIIRWIDLCPLNLHRLLRVQYSQHLWVLREQTFLLIIIVITKVHETLVDRVLL